MARKDGSVARRLFHCSRAIGQALDENGDLPMAPDGLRYAEGTVVYVAPSLAPRQLYVAPELSQPGAVRDARTTCYEAAMCLRAHVEGEEAFERAVLGVEPDADVERAWDAWLADPGRDLPEAAPEAYGEMEGVSALLTAWTRRDPQHRKIPPDGWHALSKAVLDADPEATGAATPPPLAQRIPTWLVRAALVAVAVGLAVLLGWLLRGSGSGGGGDARAGAAAGAVTAAAAEPLVVTLDTQTDTAVKTWTSTLLHDRIVLPRAALASTAVTLRLGGTGAGRLRSARLHPAAYWHSGDLAAATATGLPGVALLRQAPASGTWTGVDASSEELQPHAFDGARTVRLALEGGVPLAQLKGWAANNQHPVYCLASDVQMDPPMLLLARVVLGERTLDVTVPSAPVEPGDGPKDATKAPAPHTERPPLAPTPTPRPSPTPTPTPSPTPSPAPSPAPTPTPAPMLPVEIRPPRPGTGTGRLPVSRAALHVEYAGKAGGPMATPRRILPAPPGWNLQALKLGRKELGEARPKLRIALPARSPSGARELVLWPASYWQPPEDAQGCRIERVPVQPAQALRQAWTTPRDWRQGGGPLAAWRIEAPAQLPADAHLEFAWADARGLNAVTGWLERPNAHILLSIEPPELDAIDLVLARLEVPSAEEHRRYDVLLPVPIPPEAKAAQVGVLFLDPDMNVVGDAQAVTEKHHEISMPGDTGTAAFVALDVSCNVALAGEQAPVVFPAWPSWTVIQGTEPARGVAFDVADPALFPIRKIEPVTRSSLVRVRSAQGMRVATDHERPPRHVVLLALPLADLLASVDAGTHFLWDGTLNGQAMQVLVARVRIPWPEPFSVDLTIPELRLRELLGVGAPGAARGPPVSFEMEDVVTGRSVSLPFDRDRIASVTRTDLKAKRLNLVLGTPPESGGGAVFKVWPPQYWTPGAPPRDLIPEKVERHELFEGPTASTRDWAHLEDYVYALVRTDVRGMRVPLAWQEPCACANRDGVLRWLRGVAPDARPDEGRRLYTLRATLLAPRGTNPTELMLARVVLSLPAKDGAPEQVYQLRLRDFR